MMMNTQTNPLETTPLSKKTNIGEKHEIACLMMALLNDNLFLEKRGDIAPADNPIAMVRSGLSDYEWIHTQISEDQKYLILTSLKQNTEQENTFTKIKEPQKVLITDIKAALEIYLKTFKSCTISPEGLEEEKKQQLRQQKEEAYNLAEENILKLLGLQKKKASSVLAFDGEVIYQNAIKKISPQEITVFDNTQINHLAVKCLSFGSPPTLINAYHDTYVECCFSHAQKSAQELWNECKNLGIKTGLQKLNQIPDLKVNKKCSDELTQKMHFSEKGSLAFAEFIYASSLKGGRVYFEKFGEEHPYEIQNELTTALENGLFGKTLGPALKIRENAHGCIQILYLNKKLELVAIRLEKNHTNEFLLQHSYLDTPSKKRHGPFGDFNKGQGVAWKIENNQLVLGIIPQIRLNKKQEKSKIEFQEPNKSAKKLKY